MNTKPSTESIITRRPSTLAKAARRIAFINLAFWIPFLWVCARAVFSWWQSGYRVNWTLTLATALWNGFFIGFVGSLSVSHQVRRRLLLGRLEPSVEEWDALQTDAQPPRPMKLWRSALWTAIVMLSISGLCTVALKWMIDQPDVKRIGFVFTTALLPGSIWAFVSSRVARSVARRFVWGMEHAPVTRVGRRRFIWQSVLPYVGFSSIAAWIVGFERFGPRLAGLGAVAASEAIVHVTIAVAIITLVVVPAANLKVRIDLLGPNEIVGATAFHAPRRWRFWYALLVPAGFFLVFTALRVGLGWTEISVWAALVFKTTACMLVSLFVLGWSVTSTLDRLRSVVLQEHPYVRWYRWLRRAGAVG